MISRLNVVTPFLLLFIISESSARTADSLMAELTGADRAGILAEIFKGIKTSVGEEGEFVVPMKRVVIEGKKSSREPCGSAKVSVLAAIPLRHGGKASAKEFVVVTATSCGGGRNAGAYIGALRMDRVLGNWVKKGDYKIFFSSGQMGEADARDFRVLDLGENRLGLVNKDWDSGQGSAYETLSLHFVDSDGRLTQVFEHGEETSNEGNCGAKPGDPWGTDPCFELELSVEAVGNSSVRDIVLKRKGTEVDSKKSLRKVDQDIPYRFNGTEYVKASAKP